MKFSLHTLPAISEKGKKRVGRGYGCGKGGHTSGRGQKGQRSRRTIPWSFEGGALALNRRMPFVRGKGRLNVLFAGPAVINVGQLEKFADGTIVTAAFLVKERLVHEEDLSRGIKVLGRGKLLKKVHHSWAYRFNASKSED